MEELNLNKNNLRKFGLMMGSVFFVITLVILVKHRHSILPTAIVSTVFFISAFFMPHLLKLVYVVWMKLAFILAWFNTRLILSVLFYLILTPLGLAIKLCRVDLLDRKIEKNKTSYWQKKEKKKFTCREYERMF